MSLPESAETEARIAQQSEVLRAALEAEGEDVAHLEPPHIDFERTMMPPNIQWIEEDGGYQLFGQRWPIPDVAPSLKDLGLQELVAPGELSTWAD